MGSKPDVWLKIIATLLGYKLPMKAVEDHDITSKNTANHLLIPFIDNSTKSIEDSISMIERKENKQTNKTNHFFFVSMPLAAIFTYDLSTYESSRNISTTTKPTF